MTGGMENTASEQPKSVLPFFHDNRIMAGQAWLPSYTTFSAFLVVGSGQVTKLWPIKFE